MCGIIAYIGNRQAKKVLIEGLTILQNRGYDSAGIATINPDGKIITTKSASKNTTSDSIQHLSKISNIHGENSIGISHTRWATHGAKSDKNSHPHSDNTGRFSLVHNGVIENHNDIRKFLSNNNIECISETDTEVIVQLISYYSSKGNDFETSVKSAVEELEGTWGLVILDSHNPDRMITARHGSPMLIGIGSDDIFIGSEVAAFQKYTTQYISLDNNEIVTVSYDPNNSVGSKTHLKISNYNERVKNVEKEEILISPDPYPYWTIREITMQPQTINSALNNGGRIYNDKEVRLGGLERNKKRLLGIKNLIITGCGTSLNSGLYASSIFRSIAGFDTVQVIDASEFDMSYVNNLKDAGILALSQSGETKDVMRCLEMITSIEDLTTFSVVNRVGSQVSRTTKCGVYLNAGREVAVASTKAFTSQVTVLSMIGVWFGQHRGIHLNNRINMINNIRKLGPYYDLILNNSDVNKSCIDVANYLTDKNTCFVLGKGNSAYIAYEGALKIKEIGYLHAEGYPGGSLKHGPFALIEEGTPIIIILLDDHNRSYMESTISEVKSRSAYTIVITNIHNYNDGDVNILIPENGILSSLLAVVPLQLISYQLSLAKCINPDKPRNLAKTVTVI